MYFDLFNPPKDRELALTLKWRALVRHAGGESVRVYKTGHFLAHWVGDLFSFDDNGKHDLEATARNFKHVEDVLQAAVDSGTAGS